MDKGATRYTLMAGTVELRQAIVAKLERENGLRYAHERDHGRRAAPRAPSTACSRSRFEPGDEVIIPAPYWVSYPDMVLASDGVPVTVPCPEAAGLQAHAGATRSRDHAAHALAADQFAEQPDRRELHHRRVPCAGRSAAAPPAGAGDDRRHLRAHPLRRPAAHRTCCKPHPNCASAPPLSTACPRPTP